MKAQELIFDRYEIDAAGHTLRFYYAFDTGETFCEQLVVDVTWHLTPARQEALERAAFGLWVMMGISYFKAYLPPKITFKQGGLSEDQATFFTKVYQHGLGELFVVNELDPHDRVHFEATSVELDGVDLNGEVEGSLVAIGGGKDSLTTAEILKRADEPFTTWSTWNPELIGPMMQQIGAPSVNLRRILPPELLELGQRSDAYQGHVPFSAIYSFISAVVCIITGRQNAIFSNEASADQPNLIHYGMPINHQYSKSLEYEQDFQAYLQQFISPDLNYFSFLRPLTELRIAEVFGTRFIDDYFGMFSSCNKNWRQNGVTGLGWCGECPKCAFVFLIFSPFVPKEKLLQLFGHDLLGDEKLTSVYREIFGLEGYKPFECIGEVEEARAAAMMALESGQYPAVARFELEPEEFDFRSMRVSAMPERFYEILRSVLDR